MVTMWKETKEMDNGFNKLGIIYVDEFYKEFFSTPYPDHPLLYYKDFIVARWRETDDGKIDKNQGFFIVAICRQMPQALILFKDILSQ